MIGGGDGIESRLPFEMFSTLKDTVIIIFDSQNKQTRGLSVCEKSSNYTVLRFDVQYIF